MLFWSVVVGVLLWHGLAVLKWVLVMKIIKQTVDEIMKKVGGAVNGKI